MAMKVERLGERNAEEVAFFDVDEVSVRSTGPGLVGGGAPATQVHMVLRLRLALPSVVPGARIATAPLPPLALRFCAADDLDPIIEALIEHRTYTFGRREWSTDGFVDQGEVER